MSDAQSGSGRCLFDGSKKRTREPEMTMANCNNRIKNVSRRNKSQHTSVKWYMVSTPSPNSPIVSGLPSFPLRSYDKFLRSLEERIGHCYALQEMATRTGTSRFREIIDKFSSGRISTEKRMNYEEDTYEFLVLTKEIHVKLKVVCRPQAC